MKLLVRQEKENTSSWTF